MIIREAKTSDAAAICNISSNDLGYPCEETLVLQRLNQLDSKWEAVFVAELDGKVAGKTLMKRVEDWAKEKGIKEIRLNSGGARKEAHEFYRAVGFDDEKVQIRFLKEME